MVDTVNTMLFQVSNQSNEIKQKNNTFSYTKNEAHARITISTEISVFDAVIVPLFVYSVRRKMCFFSKSWLHIYC